VNKTIRVDDDTHAALEALKGEGETFDELLSRLVAERRESIREGAGLWAETDAADRAREARTALQDDVGSG
jgi:predicted CopG family antitoxin